MRLRGVGAFAILSIATGFGACTLNPQPLPPEVNASTTPDASTADATRTGEQVPEPASEGGTGASEGGTNVDGDGGDAGDAGDADAGDADGGDAGSPLGDGG